MSTLLPLFNHTYFVDNFPPESWVIVDDFAWNPSPEQRTQFNTVINFTLRHFKISLILSIHNVFFSKLFNEINLCHNIFLTFSNHGKKYLFSQGKQYRHFLDFFTQNQTEKYSISFFSNIRDLFVLNCNHLITSNSPFEKTLIMYTDVIYTIHNSKMPCDAQNSSESLPSSSPPLENILNDILEDYPKQKKAVKVIIRTVKPYIRDESLFVQLDEKNSMHLSDVISIFFTPYKRANLTSNQTKFLKKMKTLGLKWPHTIIKNPQVKQLVM